LICKKHGVLARELAERMKNISLDDPNYAFKLGIACHVYADTWAHQEFAGITSLANVVKDW